MKKAFIFSAAVSLLMCCGVGDTDKITLVSNATELSEAIAGAEPGAEIVMKNGVWTDIQIDFVGYGTERSPILLKAETPGQVILQGQSNLRLGGNYLVVDGLYFTQGASPSRAVIQYYIDRNLVANNSRVTNCVIKDYNKSQRNKSDLWVLFKGRNNQLDHSYLAGKSNRGPTIRVDLEGNQSINNYHEINNNHFGPRPPKGGPSAETIQIGNSSTSMSPSYTQVYSNLFDRCSGEVEIISSKSNFNEFRNNVFYKSEGSLVTRHGNYCIIDGNYFIGDDESNQVGGIRLIGTGHWVTNNYFYKLKGEVFRAPIAVMNGIPRSSINRYIQVTDVNVAYNTFVNCLSPWQFGVGSNVDQKGVLPPSEIRSLTPVRTTVANNLIYNDVGDKNPIVRHDSIDGIDFRSNVINNQNVAYRGVEGLEDRAFSMLEAAEDFWIPSSDFIETEAYQGFEYDRIEKDLLGNSRIPNNLIGAVSSGVDKEPGLLQSSTYGPAWFDASPKQIEPTVHSVESSSALIEAIANAVDGDIIALASEQYELSASLKIDKTLTIQSKDTANRARLVYIGRDETPLFELNPDGKLHVKSILLEGNGGNYAFASLRENMSSLYNLSISDSEIANFDFVLKAYKYSFSEFIKIQSSVIRNCNNGLELSGEDDDRGEYNAENIVILDSQFDHIDKNVVDYYRGGYDESTVGGNLVIQGSTFTNCGAREENSTLINTYGIINVQITGNTFKKNPVRLVARLWGAKNNSASSNVVENSGEIIVEQNLPLKLIY